MLIEAIAVASALLAMTVVYFVFIRPAMNKQMPLDGYDATDAASCERVHGDLWERRGSYPEMTGASGNVLVNRAVFYCPACDESRTPTIYNGRHVDEL
jgi:hypothetical protein